MTQVTTQKCLKCLCDRGLRKSPNSLLFLKDTIFVFYKIIPGIILSTWLVASHAGGFRGARISSLPTNAFVGREEIRALLQCLYIICRYKAMWKYYEWLLEVL